MSLVHTHIPTCQPLALALLLHGWCGASLIPHHACVAGLHLGARLLLTPEDFLMPTSSLIDLGPGVYRVAPNSLDGGSKQFGGWLQTVRRVAPSSAEDSSGQGGEGLSAQCVAITIYNTIIVHVINKLCKQIHL